MKCHFVCLLLVVLSSCTATRAATNCPQLPKHTPKNVHDLHPNDIKVVMAIGDSITAGFGIMGYDGGLDEFRGSSWSIGADPNRTTIFNLFQHFVPDVIGGSVGSHFVEICQDDFCPSPHIPAQDRLNGAQSGAYTQNLPDQVDYLVAQLKNNSNVDFDNDWKVLTILIGANNLCMSCFSELGVLESAQVYEDWLVKTLTKIDTEIPRVFVNIVDIFNISLVYTIAANSTYCTDIHRVLVIECVCAFDPFYGADNRAKMDAMSQAYNNRTAKVVSQLKKQDDFAVVIQPQLRNGHIPNIEWLSTLDCFHPSLTGHEGLAVALWNNMLTPVAKKKTFLNPEDVPICPDNSTKLYTS
eukprot:TRINITY_DN1513_c0_g1_i1.p1 TRINITY_DN1513_c0_g1~~TRINITY_DN1513_c0_g1_i1.p1  ORF type:complete len:355 (+),score=51.54 TRINITY_DN1513_c0_g1_i1:90-1154(+)